MVLRVVIPDLSGGASEYRGFEETKWRYVRCHWERFPTSYVSPKSTSRLDRAGRLGIYWRISYCLGAAAFFAAFFFGAAAPRLVPKLLFGFTFFSSTACVPVLSKVAPAGTIQFSSFISPPFPVRTSIRLPPLLPPTSPPEGVN